MAKELKEEEVIEILNRVKSGSLNSFNAIVICYEREVFSLSLRLLKNREEAEEAAQDAFVKAFQQLRSFKGESRFSTWLFRITYNTCLNRLRKNKREQTVTYEDFRQFEKASTTDIWDTLKGKERSYFLDIAINKLDEEGQLLITLYYQHERTISEIKDITGLNVNVIKVKLFRSRQKLEKYLNFILSKEIKNLY